MLEFSEWPKIPGMVSKVWLTLKGTSYVEVIFMLFWIIQRLIGFKLQKNKTGNGSSNIKGTATEIFQLQMPVLHQSKCISKAGPSSLRDFRAACKDKLLDV